MLLISIFVLIISGFLIVYHHLGYPVLLTFLNKKPRYLLPFIDKRSYIQSLSDDYLPYFSILIPAYNEEAFIQQKIFNLSSLDYPMYKFDVTVVCDGCTDQTFAKANEAAESLICEHLNIHIVNQEPNTGKVAILNNNIPMLNHELVVLSDVSSLLPVDTLLSLAAHFKDKEIGAVSNAYRFAKQGLAGEKSYWQYQVKIKMSENNMGHILGAHGACYAIRKSFYKTLNANTINDDFVIPMNIASQGLRVTYEPRVASIELECADMSLDKARRKRISMGNVQQIKLLWHTLSPKYGWLAFNFFSGKLLRVLMPYCFIMAFISTLAIASLHWLGVLMLIPQLIIYSLVYMIEKNMIQKQSTILSTIHYLFMGHWASLKGSLQYLLTHEVGAWKRAEESIS